MQVLGMDLLKSGFYSVLPWITMAISSNLAGYVADTLIQRGTSVTLVRKVMQTVRACRMLPTVPCLLVACGAGREGDSSPTACLQPTILLLGQNDGG